MGLKFGVIIHGGAWDIPDDAVNDHLKGVSYACNLAWSHLNNGGSALNAVEKAVTSLEDDSTFDAGRGSFVNQLGEVEMDAIIATADHKLGSVCAIQNVKNPIKVARLVMEKSKHVMLVGKGATSFAREHGIDSVTPEDLLVGRELERYHKIKIIDNYEPKDSFKHKRDKGQGMGTVGAVCLDKNGDLAIGVSTGGTPFKKPGRVGDTPL